MFNKYFRSYPWWLQLVLFVLMTFTMLSFASVMLFALFPKLSGYTVQQIFSLDEHSPIGLIRATIIFQGVSSIATFMIPALLFAYLTHPQPSLYLGITRPKKPVHLLLAICIIIGAMPLLSGLEALIGHINFSADVKAKQEASEHLTNALLTMPTAADFIKALVVMALVPAIGEELFFRGVLMRFAKKKSRTMAFPIVFTALVFAFSHTNIYGYASIFLAGLLLAVIYYLTGSLWCSILAHLFFNGTQIVLTYMSNTNIALKNFLGGNSLPAYLPIAGAIIFAISFYLLYKTRTPLQSGWEDDYSPAERAYLNKQQ